MQETIRYISPSSIIKAEFSSYKKDYGNHEEINRIEIVTNEMFNGTSHKYIIDIISENYDHYLSTQKALAKAMTYPLTCGLLFVITGESYNYNICVLE